MSLPEVLLWQLLKGQPQGVKFRRQHPSSELGLDFYCSDARLVIEVDGIAHDMGDRPERDARRDMFLRSNGIETVRFPARDILKDATTVAESVVQLAKSRLPLHHPALAEATPPSRPETRSGRATSPRQARGGLENIRVTHD
ncbi:MAG: DUF559 domain-containing protein [Alphaproteobacteria bacterium]|nr:DUF559 domain-containing protein [Alphaproteobacteria bacterium]